MDGEQLNRETTNMREWEGSSLSFRGDVLIFSALEHGLEVVVSSGKVENLQTYLLIWVLCLPVLRGLGSSIKAKLGLDCRFPSSHCDKYQGEPLFESPQGSTTFKVMFSPPAKQIYSY